VEGEVHFSMLGTIFGVMSSVFVSLNRYVMMIMMVMVMIMMMMMMMMIMMMMMRTMTMMMMMIHSPYPTHS
jgi:hypothetical protein